MTTDSPALSWYQVPEDVKSLLLAAADSWEDSTQADGYIQQVLNNPNLDLDVLITAYRYFFYRNNNLMALQIANQVVDRLRQQEQLPQDWAELQPVLQQRQEEEPIRLFLNAYTASGFVLARLGETERAREIATQVKQLDDRNEFGAATILSILDRPADDDDD